jgi:ABC-type transport system involved in multi-copper enzyme maturation permease subunit
MKVIDIALKDMLRSFRSTLAVGMMFVVPLLVTGLIYFAFGGVINSSGEQSYSLPVVNVTLVNQDVGDTGSGINAGQMLVELLAREGLQEIFAVTESSDPAAARTMVDNQQSAVALILPPSFSQAALTGSQDAAVELYQDPTLSFGPSLLREVVEGFLDGFSGGRIAGSVVADQFTDKGVSLDPARQQQIMAEYATWLQTQVSTDGWSIPVDIRKPNQAQAETAEDRTTNFFGPVMMGMLIFFVFFGAANAAQMIIHEQEEGTLARLFSTPTTLSVILGGKFTFIFALLIVQSVVLLVISALAFGINWGNPLSVTMVVAGLVVSSAGLGVCLMSFVKTSRQAGPVIGGFMTFLGMAGGLFTTGFPTVPAIFETTSLLVPHGWAMRAFKLTLAGAAPQEVLLPVGVMLAFGIVLFTIGARGFRNRFA